MSIDDQRELRQRLDGALEAITPSPAPVAAILRKGKTMRTRRRIGVAAGLAAAVGIALAAPSLVHQFVRQEPIAPTRPVLAVYPPGPHPPPGQIAWGTINGKRWQIAVSSGSGPQGQCLEIDQNYAPACGSAMTASADPSVPVLFAGSGYNGVTYQYGVTQPDVARVVIALADGAQLTLRPYRLHGQRWVAFAVPSGQAIARATAYSARSELAFAIPFDGYFNVWLSPGSRGLPRATYKIGSGVVNGVAWSDVLHAGPWGYCFPSVGACLQTQSRAAMGNSFGGAATIAGGNLIVQGSASPSVAYVVGTLSDGSTVRARAVDAGGPKFWVCGVPKGLRIRRVVFYSASGRQVAVDNSAGYPPP
jgi:hypothetical protein